jgi:phycocyanobilin:ferredoxin oxidoreductase
MVRESEHDFEWIDIMKRYDDQLHYVNQQRKNTKTKAVLSQWFDNDWADTYIEQVLFDKPKL